MAIAHGPVTQVAWVTEDLDATAALLSRGFGVGEWTRLPDVHFDPEHCTLHGRPADFVVHVALAYAGDLQLELIQPVRGESIYTEFLARSGPGLHHLCFEIDDMAAARGAAEVEGLEVVQAGSMMDGAMEFAYLDGRAHGVPYVELARIGPDLRTFFDAIRGA